MIRALGCAALLCAAPALAAQQVDTLSGGATRHPTTWPRAVAHYGKWVTAAAAVGFTALAVHEHDFADRNWQQLLALCHADNQRCLVGSNGRYGDATAEQLYQATVYYDRRARRRLIAGQISLLTTAVAFIFDLRHGSSEPKNIPLHGELIAEPRRIGVRLHL
jgi:hypothetical protein